jgi:hypothetical protein
MKKNIGTIDKTIRIMVAVLLIVLYFTHVISGVTGILLLAFAGVLIVGCFFSICLLYIPFGISTRSIK